MVLDLLNRGVPVPFNALANGCLPERLLVDYTSLRLCQNMLVHGSDRTLFKVKPLFQMLIKMNPTCLIYNFIEEFCLNYRLR